MTEADHVRCAPSLSGRPLHEALVSRRPRLMFEKHHGIAGLKRVARRSAVTEPRTNVAQIAARADWFAAKPTETLPEWYPVIDQHEFHVTPPKAKADGGAQSGVVHVRVTWLSARRPGAASRRLPAARTRKCKTGARFARSTCWLHVRKSSAPGNPCGISASDLRVTRNRHSQRLSLSRRALKCSTHLLEQRAVRQQ